MTQPAAWPAFDRLVRKEVALGSIREMLPPTDHVGLAQIAPFMNVATDDVIFDYIKGGLSEGLAPARAEDAESELSQKDEGAYIQGRASVIDWSLKDKYTDSDVTRYRDGLLIQEQLSGINGLSVAQGFVGSTVDDFTRRLARHDALRRRKLDNRLEWLIWTAMEYGAIVYNDGRIKFNVQYGRPADQQDVAPAGGLWGVANSDPIGDCIAFNDFLWNRYKVTVNKAFISRKIVHSIWKSNRFTAAAGIVVGGTPSAPIDLNYVAPQWGPDAALRLLSSSTGIDFQVYDSVYRTRPIGSQTWTNNRFFDERKILFLPAEDQLAQIDSTDLGFGKMLTSPHSQGNWTPGFYEWEGSTQDPWMQTRGSGIKAFPVFPLLEYSGTMQVLA